MNLLFINDLKSKKNFYVILLINTIPESNFNNFLMKISSKGDWVEELCCCYYETDHEKEYYRFETFEGNHSLLPYEQFTNYIELAIIRYLLACSPEKRIVSEKIVNRTIFASALDNVEESFSTGVPLVGE